LALKIFGTRKLRLRLTLLVRHPFFWILTISGNSFVLLGASLLYHFESTNQTPPIGFLDCLLWSTGMVTTVGYGSYTPVTLIGKLVVLALMFLGTVFIWSYMGFIVTGFISPELASLEREVHDLERELLDLRNKN